MTKPIQIKNIILGQGMPKICVPLTAQTAEELFSQAEASVAAGADLVEWRADFFEELEQEVKTSETLELLSDIVGQVPLLFTIRTKKEGGNREISTDDYVNYNLLAARTGYADLVDVEAFGDEEEKKKLISEIRKLGVKVIASTHDFQKTDSRETLLSRFLEMDASGADILKMAVMPKDFEDVAAIMQATNEMTKLTDRPLISMAMGDTGSMSRISGENFGSCVTFGTVGKASAPGQFPIKELRMMMEALHRKNQE